MKDCTECNAACCRSIAVPWNKPADSEDWGHVKWLVSHKNINVYLDHDDDWLVEFLTDCEHLDENHLCRIYDKRMDICKDMKPDECEKNGEEEYYQIIFRSYDDVNNYLKKNPKASIAV